MNDQNPYPTKVWEREKRERAEVRRYMKSGGRYIAGPHEYQNSYAERRFRRLAFLRAKKRGTLPPTPTTHMPVSVLTKKSNWMQKMMNRMRRGSQRGA